MKKDIKKIFNRLMILVLLISVIVPYVNVKADGESRVQVVKTDSSGNGTFTVLGGSHDGTINYNSTISDFFNLGTSVTLTATPDNRWTFVGWYNCEEYEVVPGLMGWRTVGDALSISTTYTFSIEENYYNIMPVFETGHNNIWATDGGSIAVAYDNSLVDNQDGNNYSNGDVVDFVIGDSITVKAQANNGYRFVGWYVSDVTRGPDYYDREKLVCTDLVYTYQPKITKVDGIDEPINYLTAVFEEENQKEYILSTTDGMATAIFTFEGNHDFVLNIFDALTMTAQEIEDMTGFPANQFIEAKKTIANNVKQYGDLISLYSISIDDGSLSYSDALKLRIKLTESMKKYNTLKFVYIDENNNFAVEDVKDVSLFDEYGEVDLDHLSAYALVGSNTTTESTSNININPKTGDNILFYVLIFGLSFIGLAGSGIYIKRKMFN